MAASWAQPWRPAVSHFSRSGTDSDRFHVAALMLALLRLPLLGLALLPILCHLYRGRPCDIRRGSPCYEVGAERSQLVLRWSVFEGASLDPAGDRAEMKRGTSQNQFLSTGVFHTARLEGREEGLRFVPFCLESQTTQSCEARALDASQRRSWPPRARSAAAESGDFIVALCPSLPSLPPLLLPTLSPFFSVLSPLFSLLFYLLFSSPFSSFPLSFLIFIHIISPSHSLLLLRPLTSCMMSDNSRACEAGEGAEGGGSGLRMVLIYFFMSGFKMLPARKATLK